MRKKIRFLDVLQPVNEFFLYVYTLKACHRARITMRRCILRYKCIIILSANTGIGWASGSVIFVHLKRNQL